MDYKDKLKNIEMARNVYTSNEGRILLTDLLNDLDFFNMDLQTQQDMARQNSARLLLNKLGIWRKGNMKRIVDALLDMSYFIKEENDESV